MAGCDSPDVRSDVGRLSLAETLGDVETAGYARALAPRPFSFPEDHGPHPAFKTEWWYVTGNVTTADGRPFGFQFTVFRSALSPPDRAAGGGASAWSTNQAFMGHFGLSDPDGGTFHAFERFARGAVGIAGAHAAPFRVWIDDWALESESEDAFLPLRLSARADGAALDLRLVDGKPRVLQGRDGLSQKGPEPGNASYYYAYTRLPVEGTIRVGGESLAVAGSGWLDREWSTSSLGPGQVGWDWFALQLDDGWDLMVYQLRNADGSADPTSDGVLVSPEGERVPLRWGRDFEIAALDQWRSAVDGASYPSRWKVTVPSRDLDLTVVPVLEDQELNLAFRYWEGAVRVEGSSRGEPVRGRGYVELTGYAGPRPSR